MREKGFSPQRQSKCGGDCESFLEKTWATNQTTDESLYVQNGWDTIKKEISENESFYTQEKCTPVGKQWAKLLEVIRKK